MNSLQSPIFSSDSLNSTAASHQLVFIDRTVEGAEQLAASVVPGVKTILLDPTQDSVAQITATWQVAAISAVFT